MKARKDNRIRDRAILAKTLRREAGVDCGRRRMDALDALARQQALTPGFESLIGCSWFGKIRAVYQGETAGPTGNAYGCSNFKRMSTTRASASIHIGFRDSVRATLSDMTIHHVTKFSTPAQASIASGEVPR